MRKRSGEEKEKPPSSADFCEDADSGGDVAPSAWLTSPHARTLRRGGLAHPYCTASEEKVKRMVTLDYILVMCHPVVPCPCREFCGRG